VSTGVAPSVTSIDMDNSRSVQLVIAFLVAVGPNLRLGIRTLGDLMERRFAQFSDIPYQSPLSRQQWEDLWQTEAAPWQPRSEAPRTARYSPSDR
jgi:hypothetical protein